MYETRTHAVYAVPIFHIALNIRSFFNAVRLVIYWFGGIFYVEIESAMELHCRSPPLEIFETN